MGYLLAGPLLVFSILTGTAILVIFLVMSSKGMPTSIGIEVFFAIIIVVSLVLSVLYITRSEITKERIDTDDYTHCLREQAWINPGNRGAYRREAPADGEEG